MNSNGSEGVEFGNGNHRLDPAVLAALPEGCTVVSTAPHGKSFWATTGRIHVELADGARQSFFSKVISNDTGRNMIHSEFESMKAIHGIVPDFAPRPVAWGTFRSDAKTHFYLCEFRDFGDEMPVPDAFTARLAKLHQNSQSPDGKFGFHVTTYAGNLPQQVGWESSWEAFFAKSLRHALDLEIKVKGPDPELDALLPVLFDRVIPRLLRPLETHGRSVKPSLVHGDLWYANSEIDRGTGSSIVFDTCCFYAHNEYEFGQWRPSCNGFDGTYLTAYQKHVGKSTPVEDYDGRIDLYKLRFNTHVSALFFGNMVLREQMLRDTRDLVQRYGDHDMERLAEH